MKSIYNILLILIAAAMFVGCESGTSDIFIDQPPMKVDENDPYCNLLLSLNLAGAERARRESRAGFDDFDNFKDSWGEAGENMEKLRIMILDGENHVEYNSTFTLDNAIKHTTYAFKVKRDDTKTILFIANDNKYTFNDETGNDGGALQTYLEELTPGTQCDIAKFRKFTVHLSGNSIDGKGMSFKTPLLITAIHTLAIPPEVTEIKHTFDLHRAAVKYSFRIINLSEFNHTLEEISIDRIADREFLFPDADYETGSTGQLVPKTYRTPDAAQEHPYTYTLPIPLSLPRYMTDAVQACPAFHVPEGLKADKAQRVSITLDGQKLDICQDLKWVMPGETEATPRPMADLPRNTHVVVNITIRDTGIDLVADVQPYASVEVNPFFGLDRDIEGNIIIKRYPNGTYDIIEKGETITKDADGDIVIRTFSDGTLLCKEVVYKDYIHDDTEVDYEYVFEKDASGGNMIIIRQQSAGGTYHGDEVLGHEHDHDFNDRPLFVLDKSGIFQYVTYDAHNKPHLSPNDMHGDEILQVNGYQFRDADEMHKYIGSYLVINKAGEEELRYFKDGSTLDMDKGVPERLRVAPYLHH